MKGYKNNHANDEETQRKTWIASPSKTVERGLSKQEERSVYSLCDHSTALISLKYECFPGVGYIAQAVEHMPGIYMGLEFDPRHWRDTWVGLTWWPKHCRANSGPNHQADHHQEWLEPLPLLSPSHPTTECDPLGSYNYKRIICPQMSKSKVLPGLVQQGKMPFLFFPLLFLFWGQ